MCALSSASPRQSRRTWRNNLSCNGIYSARKARRLCLCGLSGAHEDRPVFQKSERLLKHETTHRTNSAHKSSRFLFSSLEQPVVLAPCRPQFAIQGMPQNGNPHEVQSRFLLRQGVGYIRNLRSPQVLHRAMAKLYIEIYLSRP